MVLVDELHPAISSAFCLWGVAGIDQALNRIEAEGSHFATWLTKLMKLSSTGKIGADAFTVRMVLGWFSMIILPASA
jgi:hypothetical protein